MRKLLTTLLFVTMMAVSYHANALLITGTTTDVGGLDTLVATTNTLHDAGEITETAWVNLWLNPDVNWTVKTEGVRYYQVDDIADSTGSAGDGIDNIFAFHVNAGWDVPAPDYFLIKNATWSALYRNLDDVAWGVFSATDLPDFNVGGNYDFEISHVSEFVDPTSVPEPSISALLGLGLLGMIGVGRRKA